jgi:hypothetical protein
MDGELGKRREPIETFKLNNPNESRPCMSRRYSWCTKSCSKTRGDGVYHYCFTRDLQVGLVQSMWMKRSAESRQKGVHADGPERPHSMTRQPEPEGQGQGDTKIDRRVYVASDLARL